MNLVVVVLSVLLMMSVAVILMSSDKTKSALKIQLKSVMFSSRAVAIEGMKALLRKVITHRLKLLAAFLMFAYGAKLYGSFVDHVLTSFPEDALRED